MKSGIGRPVELITLLVLLLGGCALIQGPEQGAGDGRSTEPDRELFVVHSLAETISSVELGSAGTLGSVRSDLQYLGAVPNHLLRVGEELIVTLSGQNELLRLDENSLKVVGRINHPAGSNPMETRHLGTAAPLSELADGLLVTTHLLAGRVRIDDMHNRSGSEPPPWSYSVGRAPQPLLPLPGDNSGEVRLLVANTNFSTDSSRTSPFGKATLTAMVFGPSEADSPAGLEMSSTETIDLEPSDFDPSVESGTNPTALIDAPGVGEVLVIGSGLNYGAGGTGSDDGVVIALDRNTLALQSRHAVGGSPGAGVLLTEGTGHRLYLGGPTGITSLYHDGTEWIDDPRLEYEATGSGGSLPFIADIAYYDETILAADFANNRILAFGVADGGRLSLKQEVAVSQGPIALLVDLE